ncbi:cysteine-rich with EGF-like domain protein 1 isoform X2 [Heterocephalus glaber]|uniref:protein disulfide-isomerase n=1 Tax=Heterocephalus glaber TaxID=10181 RepID=A0AAX6NRI5_HETGA|nr:cysteine-rich with EGF-like domain protein 1 isoform X2 [Heterocephalus glaber]
MAPQPPRVLVSALLWALNLFLSLPGPVCLQAFPPPHSPPPPEPHPCHTCRALVDSFYKGLERTIRDNFGGGNTAWEEEKLSKYKDSETRLVEVLEGVCSKSDFECHRLLELSEELVESWWFHKQQEAPDLFQWLCSDSLKLCCPAGTFGPSCLPCPGGMERPCGGYGQCQGEGTRGGSGHCDCQDGYGGEACGQCGLGYFEAERNTSHLVCSACFGPCARCSGPEESQCLQCKKGWALHHLKCVDIDECGTERANCRANQFCVNMEGAYECRDCARACLGCMGAGPGRCKKCSPGYQQVGSKCLDVDECETVVCPGENEKCENTEGGYRCICTQGYKQVEGICVKEQIPESAGFFSEMTEDELVVLQQMFFGVIICALATLAAKGDLVFTAIFIGAVAAMTGYWLSERSDRVLEGFIKGK